ncbi:MAG: transcription elongation factor GreA [Methylacidiphilales bacterium]|nr:transcription elongation factor GreA [Candidatus Methylacidiphilales bacterium]
MERKPITKIGCAILREELAKLITTDRPKISMAIAEARAMGDLKENAEYHAAREKQSFIEGRINELESILSSAQIIDISLIPDNGKIVFGTTVTLKNKKNNESKSYKIVGDVEADISKNFISIVSPFARLLIGRKIGDEITFIDSILEIVAIERVP